MKKDIIVPPIKTQGIKTKLIPFIKAKLEGIDKNYTWIEPFFGSGVVGFNVGFKNNIVSDINSDIIKFYKDIQTNKINYESISEYLETAYNEMLLTDDGWDYYRIIRDRFNENQNSLDFLFLVRACFNGLIRYSKKGNFNTPFCKKRERFQKSYRTKILNQYLNVSDVINDNEWQFNNAHFREIIPLGDSNSIIYCDPPYYGRNNDYKGGWCEEYEKELFELLSNSCSKFMLSTWLSDAVKINPMVEKYWNNYNIITKEHQYIVGGHSKNRNSVTECLISNF